MDLMEHKLSIYLIGILLSLYGMSAVADPSQDPCTDDYARIILDDKAYPETATKISAIEKLAGRCARTTGQYEFRLGSLYTAQENYVKAESLIKQGIALNAGYQRELQLALADISFSRGDLVGADKQYRKLTSAYPNWSFGYAKLGTVRLEQKKYHDAISLLDKANTLEKNAFTYRCLTIAHNQLGEHAEAVNAINMAYEMDESIVTDRDAMLAAIYSYAAIGKIEVAKNLLAMTLKAQPDLPNDPRYQDMLGYLKKRAIELGMQEQ